MLQTAICYDPYIICTRVGSHLNGVIVLIYFMHFTATCLKKVNWVINMHAFCRQINRLPWTANMPHSAIPHLMITNLSIFNEIWTPDQTTVMMDLLRHTSVIFGSHRCDRYDWLLLFFSSSMNRFEKPWIWLQLYCRSRCGCWWHSDIIVSNFNAW